MGKRIGSRNKFVSGLLLLTMVWLVGCASATERPAPSSEASAPTDSVKITTEEPQTEAIETATVEQEASVVETATVEATPPPPPEDSCPEELLPGEACVPYDETPPTGDAELVPSYAPMRAGLATLNAVVRETLLDAHGLLINTARTVVLSETVVLAEEGVSRHVPERYLAATSQSMLIRVSGLSPGLSGQDSVPLSASTYHEDSAWPGIGQAGNTQADCAVSSTYVTTEDNEDNARTGLPDGDMGSWRVCVHSHEAAHPNEFNIDVPSLPPDFEDAWLSLTTWDVDEQDPMCSERDEVYFNGQPVGFLSGANDTFSTSGPYPLNPSWVQEGHNVVEIQVNTGGCLSSDGSERWCVAIEDARLELGCAPLVETVAIAPIIPSGGDQDRPDEMLEEPEGVVLDMLLLETNVPESLVPSGAYLERARSDGAQGIIVEMIDSVTGQTVYVVEDAEKQENTYPDFSAQIDLGTKWCRTCLRSWCVWRPCFFWE